MALRDRRNREPPFLSEEVRSWFASSFPDGPTEAQRLAWPVIQARKNNLLLISPTGTGKTLAAFLAVLDRLVLEHSAGSLGSGLRCIYISPLRSLGYDIGRNLSEPLQSIARSLGLETPPVSVGVRTGDTRPAERRRLRLNPPHVLITTPESLSLLLAQTSWNAVWASVGSVIVDEVHSLVSSKRGADLALSLERLSAQANQDPLRIGLSATCRPASAVASWLSGPERSCEVVEVSESPNSGPLEFEIEPLVRSDESPYRPLTYRRMVRSLSREIAENRTTVIFANTRALAERLTHDLRSSCWECEVPAEPPLAGSEARRGPRTPTDSQVAAHHSALDAGRRREVETGLKSGALKAVVTSTSLELGIDIGSADLAVMAGLPGSVTRCLQRVGRAGHRPGAPRRGLFLASGPAEIAGAAVTAQAAREGRIEDVKLLNSPLDVLCQQIVGMACAGDCASDEIYALVRRAGPFSGLCRSDFDACLAFLSGELASPSGAYEPEPGAPPRWTAPRLWKSQGFFGVRNRRVVRWLWQNIGTIISEESVRVVCGGAALGTLEASYAERLSPGDRFVLDGRPLVVRRLDGLTLLADVSPGEPALPRWTSDRQSLSAPLALEVGMLRSRAAHILRCEGRNALKGWLLDAFGLEPEASSVLEALVEAQERLSEIPPPGGLLVEESPTERGWLYAFHAPLPRFACEALARAVCARLGRQYGRDVSLSVADLGWSVHLPASVRIAPEDIPTLIDPQNLSDDVAEGLDRGELLARRFRHVASTALMVLRQSDGRRTRVGGQLWVSQRLFPLVKAASPDHPLLKETRREVLEDLLDTPGAASWLASNPPVRFRALDAPSPFTVAWIEPSRADSLRFERPSDALRRLHARLVGSP